MCAGGLEGRLLSSACGALGVWCSVAPDRFDRLPLPLAACCFLHVIRSHAGVLPAPLPQAAGGRPSSVILTPRNPNTSSRVSGRSFCCSMAVFVVFNTMHRPWSATGPLRRQGWPGGREL